MSFGFHAWMRISPGILHHGFYFTISLFHHFTRPAGGAPGAEAILLQLAVGHHLAVEVQGEVRGGVERTQGFPG